MASDLILAPQKLTILDSNPLSERSDKKETNSATLHKEEQQQFTNSTGIQTDDTKAQEQTPYYFVPTTYSSSYISFYTEKLIDSVNDELTDWQNNGTEDSLINISNIKTILENNYNYLKDRAENRIFLAYLETIFSDDNWEYLTPQQVGFIKNQLNNFKNGEISFQNLKEFSKKLYQQKLGIDKKKKNEEETTNQK